MKTIASDPSVILGGWLPDDTTGGRTGKPDVLLRYDALRVPASYVPGDVKQHRTTRSWLDGALVLLWEAEPEDARDSHRVIVEPWMLSEEPGSMVVKQGRLLRLFEVLGSAIEDHGTDGQAVAAFADFLARGDDAGVPVRLDPEGSIVRFILEVNDRLEDA